jgi:hypothetical protein
MNTPQCWQGGKVLSIGLATVLAGMVVANPAPVNAQAAYGSYVGVGGSLGLTSGGDNEPQRAGALLAFRYKFLRAPLSLRAQAMLFNGYAIVPTVSYDIPLNWQTDLYLGVGASVPLSGEKTTPVGNRTALAIQPGIDYSFPNSNMVLFGNAIIAVQGYRDSSGTAASLQGGVGWRF